MADRPIIFSAAMVRALLDGRKTQTRRVLRRPTDHFHASLTEARIDATGCLWWWDGLSEHSRRVSAPPYAPGDRLYVREAWAPLDALNHNDCGTQALVDRGFYRADESTTPGEISRWRPSIHMPRWASRLTLTVTEVRMQRLQDISEDDAAAEGVHATRVMSEGYHLSSPSFVAMFQGLWNSLHGPDAWGANPWVVALTFTVQRGNIDQIGKA